MKPLLAPKMKGWLHRANPACKLALFVLLFLVTLFTHRPDFMFYQAVLFTLLLFLLSGYEPWKSRCLSCPFCSSSFRLPLR
ncbi:hypothetical protein HMSSN036_90480 [Paenibacillus macerans]|nr:hypothetical protein HMSSN036_90480 [Paenibacillus macerans]